MLPSGFQVHPSRVPKSPGTIVPESLPRLDSIPLPLDAPRLPPLPSDILPLAAHTTPILPLAALTPPVLPLAAHTPPVLPRAAHTPPVLPHAAHTTPPVLPLAARNPPVLRVTKPSQTPVVARPHKPEAGHPGSANPSQLVLGDSMAKGLNVQDSINICKGGIKPCEVLPLLNPLNTMTLIC